MADFMKSIREELRKYENYLENDINEFNSKLNLTQKNLFDFIDQQIEYLKDIKNQYDDELNYLNKENIRTCVDNQQEFKKLCLSINKNDHNPTIVSKLIEDFKQKFPMRPKMLQSIPKYNFKNIQIDDFITKQNFSISPINDNSLSSSVINKSILTESSDHLSIPIDDTQISSLLTTSIGFSYHKQLASQNNENNLQSESRIVSTYSSMSKTNSMLDLIFKITYEHSRTPCLMCFNEEENYLLIYSLSSHQLQYLSLNFHQISSIDFSSNELILNLGYSSRYHLFYYSTRQTNRFVLFQLNEQEKQIEIKQEVKLINEKDHFINVHIYENFIFFLYLTSSSIVMFGKYHLETSSFLPSISFEKKLYDYEEKSSYKIIDFTINNSFICFLIQLKNKNKNNKSKIFIHDYESMNKLHSFDLINPIKPISIISTKKKSKPITTTMCNDDIELLLYINDPDNRLIHCCTYQEYLISAHVSNFGICSLDDGNLVLIAKKDIRVLNIQDYLKKNKEHFH
ncbi:unnamed protein product [Rotaria sp. Silwood1]|nr:unnamed protein product [Rotaria sp. Silwood1]